jgi:aminoglycoside phosphotransferase (APT) family kinase protein
MTDRHEHVRRGTAVTGNRWFPELGDRFLRTVAASGFPLPANAKIGQVMRADGGSSWQTFFVNIADPQSGEARAQHGEPRSVTVVLRCAPVDGPLAPYSVEREFALLQELSQAGLRVPMPIALCADDDMIGRPYLVTAYVAGESHDLSKIERWPTWTSRREAVAAEIVGALAEIQAFRWRERQPEAGEARLTGSVERVHAALRRYAWTNLERADDAQTYPTWVDAITWLEENVPPLPDSELVLVHGDFRFGNFVWDGDRIAAVLDWELAGIGDPMQDLGLFCMPYSRRRRPELMGMAAPYGSIEHMYLGLTGRAIDLRRLHYYTVYWSVLHGVFTSTLMRTVERGLLPIGSAALLSPSALAVDALRLINDHEAGRYVL